MALLIVADTPADIRADEQIFAIFFLQLKAAVHAGGPGAEHDGLVVVLHDGSPCVDGS